MSFRVPFTSIYPSAPAADAAGGSGALTGGATERSVANSAASVSLLASNLSRKGASIFNDSPVTLYVKIGESASLTDYSVQIVSGGYFEVPQVASPATGKLAPYTGPIDGIWASASTGGAKLTEYV